MKIPPQLRFIFLCTVMLAMFFAAIINANNLSTLNKQQSDLSQQIRSKNKDNTLYVEKRNQEIRDEITKNQNNGSLQFFYSSDMIKINTLLPTDNKNQEAQKPNNQSNLVIGR